MADGTHHGSLNDTGPAREAALTPGQDLPSSLAALDLQQHMGLDVVRDAPLARSNTDTFNSLPRTAGDVKDWRILSLAIINAVPLGKPRF